MLVGLLVTAGLVAVVLSLNDGSDDTAGPTNPVTPSTAGASVQLHLDDCPKTDPDAPAAEGGLPDLTLDCLGPGDPVTLSGLSGAPMVINVWAQWCGPCEEELPYLAKAQRVYGGTVDFLGIDYQETDQAAALDLLGRSDVRYPQVADPDGSVRGPLQLGGLPMTLLVDADGRIVDVVTDPLSSYDQLAGLIESRLGAAPAKG